MVVLVVDTCIVDGVWSKTLGVKLFSGIVGGGAVPTGATVISGNTMLIIVPVSYTHLTLPTTVRV